MVRAAAASLVGLVAVTMVVKILVRLYRALLLAYPWRYAKKDGTRDRRRARHDAVSIDGLISALASRPTDFDLCRPVPVLRPPGGDPLCATAASTCE